MNKLSPPPPHHFLSQTISEDLWIFINYGTVSLRFKIFFLNHNRDNNDYDVIEPENSTLHVAPSQVNYMIVQYTILSCSKESFPYKTSQNPQQTL